MAFPLVLALLAYVHEAETQRQVRELELRLRQFPPAELVAYNLEIGGQHVSWLQNAIDTVPAHRRDLHAARLAEAERLCDAWCCLDEARRRLSQAKACAENGRKNDLKNLDNIQTRMERELMRAQQDVNDLERFLGEENFALGRMPPPVPVWRFQWVD